jgi:hypothetical protein
MDTNMDLENPDLDSRDSINEDLFESLDTQILSPQSGMQKIRNVLLDYGLDIGMVFDLEEDGDEIAYKFDEDYLYIIYAPNDEGYYEFYAEVTDEDGVEELLSDDLEETD